MPHLSSQRPVPALRRWLPIIAAAVMLLAALVSVGGAQEADQLRGDVPSGAALRQQLADLAERRTSLGEELARLEAELAAAIEDRDGLDGASRQLAIDIEALRSSTRRLAVSSFISGGPGFEMRYLLDLEGASDISRRRHLINTLTDPLDEDSGRLREMESQADADLLVLVDRIEALRREIERIPRELAEVLLAEAEAGSLLVIADAWDRADEAIAEGDFGFAPREKWEALRFCESSDNYRAVSPSGRYRGAYQFDLPTWQTTGGTGDPAAAPPAEQDARARELYARRGHQPWPVCGRHLR